MVQLERKKISVASHDPKMKKKGAPFPMFDLDEGPN
jgi:hypothetical protein